MKIVLNMSDVRKLVLEKFPFIGETPVEIVVDTTIAGDNVEIVVDTTIAGDNGKVAEVTKVAMSHIRCSQEFEAIKLIREYTKMGLKECKDLVEDPNAEEKIFSLLQAYIKD